ncbi:unnamed protein product [Blepharisma stoltei]|uniref:Importin subunit alpha n=1 Tax=Blepharisma stoltei TaxID=1481888 RepID=A0AAU9JQJ2_9CILI|nr:unnamed protein product [Blepharisma stoltei]
MSTAQRICDRNKGFQQSIDPELLQIKREEHHIELRRNKRFELSKKRRFASSQTPTLSFSSDFSSFRPYLQNLISNKRIILESCIEILKNNNQPSIIKEALYITRKLLESISEDSDLDIYVELNYIPVFIHYLSQDYPKEIQFEASFALCSFATFDHNYVEMLVKNGAIRECQLAISRDYDEIAENCIWCIGNIAGDNEKYREIIISEGIFDFLMDALQNISVQNNKSPLVNVLVWVLSNISRSANKIPDLTMRKLLNIVRPCLDLEDNDIIASVFWILNYSTQGDSYCIERILEAKYAPIIINYCDSHDYSIALPALKTLGNISSGNNAQTELMLNLNALEKLLNHIRSSQAVIRKEVYWALSNFVGGSSAHVERVAQHLVIPLAMKGLTDEDHGVRVEAGWVFSNFGIRGSPECTISLIKNGFLNYLQQALDKETDPNTLKNLLVITKRILEAASIKPQEEKKENNICLKLFESSGCLAALHKQLDHGNSFVNEFALKLLKEFFDYEEPEEELDIENAKITKFEFS